MKIPTSQIKFCGYLEGALLAITPLPFLFALTMTGTTIMPQSWRMIAAASASIGIFAAYHLLLKMPMFGKICLLLALPCSVLALLPTLLAQPLIALAFLLLVTLTWGATYGVRNIPLNDLNKRQLMRYHRIDGAGLVQFIILLFFALFHSYPQPNENLVLLTICLLAQFTYALHAFKIKDERRKNIKRNEIIWFFSSVTLIIWAFWQNILIDVATIIAIIPHLFTGCQTLMRKRDEMSDTWLEQLTQSPATMIPLSFAFLVLTGTLLLCLPFATHNGISPLKAMFTATSSVCVTGLSVIDISQVCTTSGKIIILLLIQIGALGIMTISPLILHFFGQRISIREEHAINNMIEADKNEDIFKTIALIIKFTFSVETSGAIILMFLLHFHGESWDLAAADAIFTSVSAFCSAGFSLHSDSMIMFQHSPAILFTTSILILCGGLSPIAAICLPKLLRRRKIAPFPRIVLLTTAWLVGFGTLLFLFFEWDGLLANLNFGDKLSNAWFQTAAARTTGLNSLNLTQISPQSYVLYLIMMFIGGSPGSTGGGIKTTIFAILLLTCWSNLHNQNSPIVRNRKISLQTISRAVTILTAYVCCQIIVIFFLLATQQMPSNQIVFEAFSALSTVGLSLGATPELNAIGQIIIIITMYIGRVGAAVLIMKLDGGYDKVERITYPNAHIPLT